MNAFLTTQKSIIILDTVNNDKRKRRKIIFCYYYLDRVLVTRSNDRIKRREKCIRGFPKGVRMKELQQTRNDFLHAYTTFSRNYSGKFIIGLSFHTICSHAFIYQHLIPFVRMHSFIIISYNLFTGLLDHGFIPVFQTHLLIVMLYHLFTRIFDYHFVPFLHMHLLIRTFCSQVFIGHPFIAFLKRHLLIIVSYHLVTHIY